MNSSSAISIIKRVGILNLLLICVPLAFVLKFTGAEATWIFLVCCIAILPLAGLMGKSTEMLAHRMGPAIGGLLNASFGNAAELIIALMALRHGLNEVVKASITGSILGNILLVLGASFLVGGMKYKRQRFNATAAGMSATLLALSAVGLLVPAMFHAHLVLHEHLDLAVERDLSLEISVVLFAAYALMLLFSLKTHSELYSAGHGTPEDEIEGASHNVDEQTAGPSAGEVHGLWSQKVSLIVLITATTFVALVSELMVGAIEETSHALGWTEVFVGVIVVAIVGNAAEHSTAILVARKNHIELSFQIAVGSGLQIALFVAPVLVFVSYLPGFAPLDLVFSMLEVMAVVVSVLIVGLVAHDGQSNWLEGLLLLAVYTILGVAFFHLPAT